MWNVPYPLLPRTLGYYYSLTHVCLGVVLGASSELSGNITIGMPTSPEQTSDLEHTLFTFKYLKLGYTGNIVLVVSIVIIF